MSQSDSDDSVLSKLVSSHKEATTAAVTLASSIAEKYAGLAPGQKPSYLGISLVILSIVFELAHSFLHFVEFSETMLLVMLISGLVVLVTGSVLEAASFWLEMKNLRDEQIRLSKERTSTLAGFFGSKKRADP
jgi:hypothetical protein